MAGNGTDNDGFVHGVIEDVAKRVGPKAVFGEPIVHGEMALIPVVTVGYGGGGGSGSGGPEESEAGGEGQGFGFGVSARPVGTLEVGPESIVYQPVIDWTQLAKIWSWIAGVALLAFVLRMLFSRR